MIGIWAAPKHLMSASITVVLGESLYAGARSDYLITLRPSGDLPAEVDYVVTFPEDYQLDYLLATDCTGPVGIKCKVDPYNHNILVLTGN